MTFVIITSGIDLSVGSVLVFSSVVAAKVMEAMGGSGVGVAAVGLVAAILSGMAWGVVNGVQAFVEKMDIANGVVMLKSIEGLERS